MDINIQLLAQPPVCLTLKINTLFAHHRENTVYLIVLNKYSLHVERHPGWTREPREPRWTTGIFSAIFCFHEVGRYLFWWKLLHQFVVVHFFTHFPPISFVYGVYSIKTWVWVVKKVWGEFIKQVCLFKTLRYTNITGEFLLCIRVHLRGWTEPRNYHVIFVFCTTAVLQNREITLKLAGWVCA